MFHMWLVATTLSDDNVPIITEGSLGQNWARGAKKEDIYSEMAE